MIKEFRKGYWCASPYWKTCQLDCSDCGMLRTDNQDKEAEIQHKINMEEIRMIEKNYGKKEKKTKTDNNNRN